MWILTEAGALYDAAGGCIVADRRQVGTIRLLLMNAGDEDLLMVGSDQECKDELRRIAIAIALSPSGARVYEIGKGMICAYLTDGVFSGWKHVPISLEEPE